MKTKVLYTIIILFLMGLLGFFSYGIYEKITAKMEIEKAREELVQKQKEIDKKTKEEEELIAREEKLRYDKLSEAEKELIAAKEEGKIKSMNQVEAFKLIKDFAAKNKQYVFNEQEVKNMDFIGGIKVDVDEKGKKTRKIVFKNGIEIKEDDIGYYEMYGIGFLNNALVIMNPKTEVQQITKTSYEGFFNEEGRKIENITKIEPHLYNDMNGLNKSASYLIVKYNDGLSMKLPLLALETEGYFYDRNTNLIYKSKMSEDGTIIPINQEYIIYKDRSKKEYKSLLRRDFDKQVKFVKLNIFKSINYNDKYFILTIDTPSPIPEIYIVNKKRKRAYLLGRPEPFENGEKLKINIKLLARILDIKNKDKIEFFGYIDEGSYNDFFKDILPKNKKYVLKIGND